jgi:hypothetical protein
MSEHLSRRRLLGAIASAPALAVPTLVAAQGADAGLFDLVAQWNAVRAEGDRVAAQVEVFAKEREALRAERPPGNSRFWRPWKDLLDAFDRDRGLDKLGDLEDSLGDKASDLVDAVIAFKAATEAGRQAQVSMVLMQADCPADRWRGHNRHMDYEPSRVRRLLGNFAGLDEETLAAI